MNENDQRSSPVTAALVFDPCPHCGHRPNPVEKVKAEAWGEYNWEIVCSSSHCRARMRIVADGWCEQLDAELNPHIPADRLYTDRLTQLRDKWNRRSRHAQCALIDNWEDDPSADERWNAGVDFAMLALCGFMGVDPHMVSWDAATETADGDVRAVIGNILRAKMGEDWGPLAVTSTER